MCYIMDNRPQTLLCGTSHLGQTFLQEKYHQKILQWSDTNITVIRN